MDQGDYVSESSPDNIMINGSEAHFCGVNKVTLPIARMRELVREYQNENLVTYVMIVLNVYPVKSLPD